LTKNLVTILGLAVWMVTAAGVDSAAASENERGEKLFAFCQQCHGSKGGGEQIYLAPAIAGLDQWYVEAQLNNFRAGLRGKHPEDYPGMRMYPMAQWLRTDEDVTAVAAYIAGLPGVQPTPIVTGGDAEKGKTVFQAVCTTCHGPDATGNQSLNVPPLRNASDWYLLSSLQRFKKGIRGGIPQNSNAVMMRGMSATLADEQAIRDVIAYIMSLRN
jgi:cytochrome c oxidase subunit 2